MAAAPGTSLPQQQGGWAATMGAYRLLHNDRVTSAAIQSEAVRQTRQRCGDESVVLLLTDLSALRPTCIEVPTRLWQLTFLAATREGRTLGLADQRWQDDVKVPVGERREERRARWRRSQWWADAAEAVAVPTRALVVADREADDFQMFHACLRAGHGFVIRAQHDRALTGECMHLFEWMNAQPVRGEHVVSVSSQRATVDGTPGHRRAARRARKATLHVRWGSVSLQPPHGDDRFDQPVEVYAVQVDEPAPPADVEPLRWLLLTTEPVHDMEQALRIVRDYQHRWLIEEYHKAQKTGCRLEKTQLKDRAAFERLAALTGVVATRLLQLRDAAEDPQRDSHRAADVLGPTFDPLWFVIVATLARVPVNQLTVAKFHQTIARHGGHLGRKSDPRPGWQALWHGYQYIATLVEGARLVQKIGSERCV